MSDDDTRTRLHGIEARLNTIGQRIGSSEADGEPGIIAQLARIEITMAATGRQIERITEHLGLTADEDGTPVTIEPFAPPDRYLAWWLSQVRDIAASRLVSDAQAGGRIRALLFPRHIHDDDGTVEGCPGCFPPGEVIPRTAMPSGVHITLQAGDLLTVSWSGELRTVICGGIGPGGMLLRDLTADEQAELEREQARESTADYYRAPETAGPGMGGLTSDENGRRLP